jgi:hypothetical protein
MLIQEKARMNSGQSVTEGNKRGPRTDGRSGTCGT